MPESKRQTAAMSVACAADAAYLPHCATMLASLADHPGPWDVHFVHDASITDAEFARLRAMLPAARMTLTSHPIAADRLAGLPRMTETTVAMWMRILLAELLPDVRRVLYLDGDTLVIEDPAPLWTIELGRAGLAAVHCVLPKQYADWPTRLGVQPDRYFNSGVLLLDLDVWREEGLADTVLALGRERAGDLHWPDQDALNIVFRDRWQRLHPRYNAQNALWFLPEARRLFAAAELRDAVLNPAIVHFEGPSMVKPWHRFSKHPYRGHYRRLRATTPWPLRQLDGGDHPLRTLHWLPARPLYGLLTLHRRLRQKLRRMTGR